MDLLEVDFLYIELYRNDPGRWNSYLQDVLIRRHVVISTYPINIVEKTKLSR